MFAMSYLCTMPAPHHCKDVAVAYAVTRIRMVHEYRSYYLLSSGHSRILGLATNSTQRSRFRSRSFEQNFCYVSYVSPEFRFTEALWQVIAPGKISRHFSPRGVTCAGKECTMTCSNWMNCCMLLLTVLIPATAQVVALDLQSPLCSHGIALRGEDWQQHDRSHPCSSTVVPAKKELSIRMMDTFSHPYIPTADEIGSELLEPRDSHLPPCRSQMCSSSGHCFYRGHECICSASASSFSFSCAW